MTRTRTTLHEIRAFLDRHGAGVPAWGEPARATEALYALLRERRDDPAFWADLADLSRRLDDARVKPALIDGAEALGGADVDHLLADLRASLPAPDRGPRSVRSWIGAGIGATALAGFLLLGSSIGCPVTGDEACAEAVDAGIVGADNAEVYCELVDIIGSAEIPPDVRDDLLDCLPELAAAEREDLLDDFENASEDELATLLEELAVEPPCATAGDDDDTTDPWDDDDH